MYSNIVNFFYEICLSLRFKKSRLEKRHKNRVTQKSELLFEKPLKMALRK